MFDFLNPGGAAGPSTGSFLNPGMDPVTQAFMLSAGLNLMNGGWGSPAQRVAQSVGSGIESAAGAGAMQEEVRRAEAKEGLAQQELDQRAQLNADDNASRERVAKMYTDQRRATAGSGGTTLERQRRQFGARAYESYKNNPMNVGQSPDELEAGARDAFLTALEHYDTTFDGGKTSPNSETGAAPLPQPGAAPAPGKTSPNSNVTQPTPKTTRDQINRVVPGANFLPTPSPAAAGPVKVKTREEALRLPPGTRFIDPNGVMRVR